MDDDLMPVLFVDEAEEYLKAGIDYDTVFEISDEMLLLNTNNPDGAYEIFSLFYEYGMEVDEIESWILAHADYKVLEDIVVKNSARWKEIGLNTQHIFNRYMAWHELISRR